MVSRLLSVVWILLLVLTGVQSAELPRLTVPLMLDGNLTEWKDAARVPVRGSVDLYVNGTGPNAWCGPLDAGMDFYCAWSAEGLCLAALVTDDEVFNDRSPAMWWQRDCLEIFLDGRAADRFMQSPYSTGAYQLLVRPPQPGQAPGIAVNPRHGSIDGMRVAGQRTSLGYTIEAVIPWQAFPDFQPRAGSPFGLQFALDDVDERDRGMDQARMLTFRGVGGLYRMPENLTHWTLVDALSPEAELSFGSQPDLSVVGVYAGSSLPIRCEPGTELSPRAHRALLRITDEAGRAVLSARMPLRRLAAPWQREVEARYAWTPNRLADGEYTVQVTLLDNKRQVLWQGTETIVGLHQELQAARARIGQVDLGTIAREQPLVAARYAGAAACLEMVERVATLGDAKAARFRLREFNARLEMLAGKTIHDDELLGLLNLAGHPDAEVVVEYPAIDRAVVTFTCGSLPLVTVLVQQYENPEDAVAAAKQGEQRRVINHDRVPDTLTFRAVAAGNHVLTAASPSLATVEQALQLVMAGDPVTLQQVDGLRLLLVSALPSPDVPAERGPFFCGDPHAHSFFSDGAPSPVGLAMAAIAAHLDFLVMTDHNTIDGALQCRQLFSKHGVVFPCIVGEEITMDLAHMNAFPLTAVIPPDEDAWEVAKTAHRQGAVIVWNHPESMTSAWGKAQLPFGLQGTSLDAWEHYPSEYARWKREGTLPVIIGSTDTHDGTFASGERTVVFAPSMEGEDIAEAVRSGRVVAVLPYQEQYLYGPAPLVARLHAELAAGDGLKAAKARQLATTLAQTRLSALLDDSTSVPDGERGAR